MKKWISFICITLLFCVFVWFKFIKEKLPKTIPFSINFFTLSFMCILIFVLLKKIYNYFFIKNVENNMLEITYKILLNNKSMILSNTLKLQVNKYINFCITHINKIIYLEVFFRFLLCICFFIDVIIYNKILYTYTCVYLYIYLYLLNLILVYWSLIIMENERVIEEQTQIEFKGSLIKVNLFIQKQIKHYINKEELDNYTPEINFDYICKRHKELKLKHNEKLNAKYLIKNVKELISVTIKIAYVLNLYNVVNAKIIVKLLRRSFTIIYLFLSIFILIKNIHYLNTNIFSIVDVFIIGHEEPFSCIKIL